MNSTRLLDSLAKGLLLLFVLCAAGCGPGSAPGRDSGVTAGAGDRGAVVAELRARPSPDGVTVGAIFGVLRTGTADTLVAVSVPASVAGRAEIHAMLQNAEGQMEMVPVPRLALAPGAGAELKPGGMHMMLFALARPLVAGETFSLTLQFARAGEMVVEVPVRED